MRGITTETLNARDLTRAMVFRGAMTTLSVRKEVKRSMNEITL